MVDQYQRNLSQTHGGTTIGFKRVGQSYSKISSVQKTTNGAGEIQVIGEMKKTHISPTNLISDQSHRMNMVTMLWLQAPTSSDGFDMTQRSRCLKLSQKLKDMEWFTVSGNGRRGRGILLLMTWVDENQMSHSSNWSLTCPGSRIYIFPYLSFKTSTNFISFSNK
ncbi:hypothetical protein YC2023_116143 [Brassica napus]